MPTGRTLKGHEFFSDFRSVLEILSRISGLSHCLHDLAGFTGGRGRRVLPRKLYLHCHPFCMEVKRRRADACVREDFVRANQKAGRLRAPFIKRCHGGALEAVVPVVLNGQHVGTIFFGPARERGPRRTRRGTGLPTASRRELRDIGRLLRVVAGYAAEAGQALMLQALQGGRQSGAVQEGLRFAANRIAEPVTVEDAARAAHLSPSRFAHLFTEETGLSFHRYLTLVRIERAKRLLAYSSYRVGQIAEQTGFCNQNYFASVFRRHVGLSPSEYRRKQQKSIDT